MYSAAYVQELFSNSGPILLWDDPNMGGSHPAARESGAEPCIVRSPGPIRVNSISDDD